MSFGIDSYRRAVQDFREARRKAAVRRALARLTGKSADLLSFEAVRRKLQATAGVESGVREIPLDAIVGSVGRYGDFDRHFLPLSDSAQDRWARVMAASTDPAGHGLPPIRVYQVGSAYFVLDGHHRVSVARQTGASEITAYVTEVRTRAPIPPDLPPEELIAFAEYTEFVDRIPIRARHPEADLRLSVPGRYGVLEGAITAYQYLVEKREGRSLSVAEAAARWYEDDYLPVIQVIRERGLLRDFPSRTEADLYLWMSAHLDDLRHEVGWAVKPAVAMTDLAERFGQEMDRRSAAARRGWLDALVPAPLRDGPEPGAWRRERLEQRYLDQLFLDILVPLSGGEASWLAVDQAIGLAQREAAELRGLHVAAVANGPTERLRAEFRRRCQQAGVRSTTLIETGEVAERIVARAALTDLVVLHLAHPPGRRIAARLASGLSAIIRRCPRPVLAVPRLTGLGRALLAYDDSPKAREALFVSAYMAGKWGIPLTVLMVEGEEPIAAGAVRYLEQYLEFHEVQAAIRTERGEVAPAILRAAEDEASELIVVGGYGARPMLELVVGSTVDDVLREASCPVLICR